MNEKLYHKVPSKVLFLTVEKEKKKKYAYASK